MKVPSQFTDVFSMCFGSRKSKGGLGNVTIKDEQGLTAAVNGDDDAVAFPNELLYQFKDAKPYNLDIPIIPAAVTYPKTAQEIAEIVRFASRNNLKVQARSGGHSYGNYCIGGVSGAIVVDMKHFQQFSIDKSTWHATIGAGTSLDDVTKRLVDNGGRAMAHGVCPQVGAGGHLTIGGFGPMSRMWGTALDHVLSAQVVLADSSIVRASPTENPDVFFAIKGAASGFGIVTEFTVRTQEAPGEMVRYSYTLQLGSFTSMAQSLKNWQKFCAQKDLSRKFASTVTISIAGLVISGTYFGSQEEFDALEFDSVFPNKVKFSTVILKDWIGLVAHWTEDIGLHVVGGTPCAFYAKSVGFQESKLMPDAAIDNLCHYLDKVDKGTLLWFVSFELQGGATNDVPANETAYAHRDFLIYMETFGIDIGRVDSITRNFVTGVDKSVRSAMPGVQFGSYPGYVDPALPDAQVAYWGSNLPKLEKIKRAIDPKDVFHNPQSVRPAAA